jgi:integrase
MAVRGFAKHMRTIDPRTEVPPAGSVPPPQRVQPYVFSLVEIRRLLIAARKSGSAGSSNRWTYPALFGLLAATGLRIGEALRLDRGDVDLRQGVVSVKGAKFGKNRFVPVHWTTKRALSAYCQRRDTNTLCAGSDRFFLSPHGKHLRYSSLLRDFHRLSQVCGFRCGPSGRPPRIHDLRHTFVVRALERVYRLGGDVQTLLPALATYLGHDRLVSTYWYFSAAPELMSPIVRRLERRWEVKG